MSTAGAKNLDGHSPDAKHDAIRERLLDAAADVFGEFGYDGARVATIAERADLTTGAIYNRFSGKTELLLEALDRHNEHQLDLLIDAGVPATDALRALGADLLGAKDTRWKQLMLEAVAAARREPALGSRLRPVLAAERNVLAEQVLEAQRHHLVSADLDPAAIAMFAQAVGLGMNLLAAIDSGLPDADGWETLIDRLVAATAPDDAS